MQQALAKRYAELFGVFVQHHNSIESGHLLGSDRSRVLAQQLSHPGANELPLAI